MNQLTRTSIRLIFLSPRPHVALMTAADLLGIPLQRLKREIADGSIVTVSNGVGVRVTKEELIFTAMRTWPQGVIEEALGEEAQRVLPEPIRLVELRARVPLYQREMLLCLARLNQTSVDEVLTRELEDVASAHAEELAALMPGFEDALAWPE